MMHLTPIYNAIETLLSQKKHVLIAIDGPCASGKSTLAQQLGQYYSAPVIPMDDFFLPPEKRTAERLASPGGNVDSQRFLTEVLTPLVAEIPFSYRPWRCKVGDFGVAIAISPAPLTIIEGAYALRPDLRGYYDLRIFLDAPLPLREERLLLRNGAEGLLDFQTRWIPLENAYFEVCAVADCCQIQLTSSPESILKK